MLGVGIPLPILREEVVAQCAVKDQDLVAPIVDFSIPRRVRPTFGLVSYAQLKSGRISIDGKSVRVAPLASIYLSRQVALELKQWIQAGKFCSPKLWHPFQPIKPFSPRNTWGAQMQID